MTYDSFKDKAVSTITLFSSFSTLLCCALPALLVALGAGSVMAGLVATVPGLVVISQHKLTVFIFAGLMLSLSAFMQRRNRRLACPINQRQSCERLKRISTVVFTISLLAYLTGLFFAYLAPFLMGG